MFNAFAVTLRECAELVLILGAAHLTLREYVGARAMRPMAIGFGIGLVLAASILWAVAGQPWSATFQAVLAVAFAVAVIVLTCGALSSGPAVRATVEKVLGKWAEAIGGPTATVAFTAVVTMQEVLETGVLLRSMRQSGSSRDDTIAGALLAVATLCVFAWAFRSMRARFNLLVAFRLSALLVSLLSIQILLNAVDALLLAAERHDLPWRSVFEPFLAGGPWYGWVCAGLMLFPIGILLNQWRRDTRVWRERRAV